MAWYSPKLYSSFELDLSNYVKKMWCKKVASVDTSSFSKKVWLASVKSDIVKLKKVSTSLNNLKPEWIK